MYRFLRNIFFLFPAEVIHCFSMNCLKILCSVGIFRRVIKFIFLPRGVWKAKIAGLTMRNPVGLGAGFDKNAKYLRELECLGFGFIEIGTVTPKPQDGNEKPRLFRLPKDKGIINRMGFNNDGVQVVAKRLKKWRDSQSMIYTSTAIQHLPLIIGGNIGKNKATLNEDAWKDYETCFKELHSCVDYFVVNVSSPNTPGLRELQEKESLRKILMHLQMINNGKSAAKPILLKIAPDLSPQQIDDVINLSLEIKLDGLVIANTTIDREQLITSLSELTAIGAGGLSGKPIQKRTTEIIKYIAQRTNGSIPVIASGGIFTGSDARENLDAGATLVQVWTGFIYEGPAIAKKICRSL